MDPDTTKEKQNEPIGRKGGAMGGSTTIERETPVQKMKEGWDDFKLKLREKWNNLEERDIDDLQSRDRTEFVGYVHERVGGDRGVVERDIDALAKETNYRFD